MINASRVHAISKLDAVLWAQLQNSSEQRSSFGLEQQAPQNYAKVSRVCALFF